MKNYPLMVLACLLVGCSTYQGAEQWRRGVCESIIDSVEKEKCLNDATRPENEYKGDLKEATIG